MRTRDRKSEIRKLKHTINSIKDYEKHKEDVYKEEIERLNKIIRTRSIENEELWNTIFTYRKFVSILGNELKAPKFYHKNKENYRLAKAFIKLRNIVVHDEGMGLKGGKK